MSPAETITTCACGYHITRGDWQAARDRGEAKVQGFPDEPTALELVACPACGSHRSIEIPRFRPMTEQRPWTLSSQVDYVEAARREVVECQARRDDAVAAFCRDQRRLTITKVAMRTAVFLTAAIAIILAVGASR